MNKTFYLGWEREFKDQLVQKDQKYWLNKTNQTWDIIERDLSFQEQDLEGVQQRRQKIKGLNQFRLHQRKLEREMLQLKCGQRVTENKVNLSFEQINELAKSRQYGYKDPLLLPTSKQNQWENINHYPQKGIQRIITPLIMKNDLQSRALITERSLINTKREQFLESNRKQAMSSFQQKRMKNFDLIKKTGMKKKQIKNIENSLNFSMQKESERCKSQNGYQSSSMVEENSRIYQLSRPKEKFISKDPYAHSDYRGLISTDYQHMASQYVKAKQKSELNDSRIAKQQEFPLSDHVPLPKAISRQAKHMVQIPETSIGFQKINRNLSSQSFKKYQKSNSQCLSQRQKKLLYDEYPSNKTLKLRDQQEILENQQQLEAFQK